eukprot:g1817.t1
MTEIRGGNENDGVHPSGLKIEFLDDDDDGDENKEEEANKERQKVFDKTHHPASFCEPIFDFKYKANLLHPGSLKRTEKNAVHAADCKARGNQLYKAMKWKEAIELYKEAIAFCPNGDLHQSNRAIYHGNCAACFLQLLEYQSVVDECSASLQANPRFVKAYMRRAKAYEQLDKLEDALADLKSACEIDPRYPGALSEQQRVSIAVTKKHEEMKTEVLGKLKDLGNMVLGKFGMSLDNFAMEEQPGGGYSIQFKQ